MLTGLLRRAVLAAAFVATTAAVPAAAQTIGTFFWQMQPYCNVVTLTLTRTPAGFAVAGLDDQCGANEKASGWGWRRSPHAATSR